MKVEWRHVPDDYKLVVSAASCQQTQLGMMPVNASVAVTTSSKIQIIKSAESRRRDDNKQTHGQCPEEHRVAEQMTSRKTYCEEKFFTRRHSCSFQQFWIPGVQWMPEKHRSWWQPDQAAERDFWMFKRSSTLTSLGMRGVGATTCLQSQRSQNKPDRNVGNKALSFVPPVVKMTSEHQAITQESL